MRNFLFLRVKDVQNENKELVLVIAWFGGQLRIYFLSKILKLFDNWNNWNNLQRTLKSYEGN